MVIVSDFKILKAVLNLEKTMWVGVEFCVANGEMAQYVHRMTPKYVMAPEIGRKTAGLVIPLDYLMYNTSESPLEYLNH